MLWDISQDFENLKSVGMNVDVVEFKMDLQMDLKLSMIDNLVYRGVEVTNVFQLTNAAELSGPVKFSVIEKDEQGKTAAVISHSVTVSFHDRIPTSIFKASSGPADKHFTTTYDVNCTLEADVQPGFEADFRNL